MQRRMTPLAAGLMLGVIWGAWHLPAFLMSGTPQSTWSLSPFLLGSVAVSVIVTPLFNRAGGSLLPAALCHFQFYNPLWSDARPREMYLFAAAALVVVVLRRDSVLSRTGTGAVIPGG